jgi:tRNA threonylcarbamoyl adenosine modification protein YeaZ
VSGETYAGGRPTILAIDCATTHVIVATGTPDGRIDGLTTWPAGYRHGETLVPAIQRLLVERDVHRSGLTGIVVGTGPGAFTGLRVGIATAKGLAHGLGLPLVGISTAEALLTAASGIGQARRHSGRPVLLLPAGPADRILVRSGEAPVLLPGGTEPGLQASEWLCAVDLGDRADALALERGETARSGLAAALVALGAARLAAGDLDDLAQLVPEYVTLPRGISGEHGEVAWSRDRR